MTEITLEPPQEVIRTNGHGTVPPVANQELPRVPNKKRRLWIVGGVAALAAVLAAVPVIHSALIHESTDDAFIDGHIVSISSKVAGEVTAVHVADNQVVREGDLLVEIDPRDYKAKVAEHLGKVATAEAEARRAEADAVRYEKIYRQDEISRQQLDNARAAAVSAEGSVAEERGALAQEELNLSYTRITAPQSGRITRKSVETGSYVQTGQGLFSIVPTEVWVTANFKETQLTHMRPGQQVSIRVDAFPGRVLSGHVESIQSGTGERFSLLPPENATGNYVKVVQRIPVKIRFDETPDAGHPLAPGMSVVPSVLVR